MNNSTPGIQSFDDSHVAAGCWNPPEIRALSWDPTGTASLSLCPLPTRGGENYTASNETETNEQSQSAHHNRKSMNLDVFLSHDGTGCTAEETECLIQCLDARDVWLATNGSSSTASATVKELSMEYRAAVCKCLMQHKERVTTPQIEEHHGAANAVEESNNHELLSLTFAISHLTEIFLLPSLVTVTSNAMLSPRYYTSSNISSNNFERRPLDGPAGSLTADTVRYLRWHHSREDKSYMDMPQVKTMLDSDQPEYYRYPSDTANVIPGPFETPFWNLILRLVIEGKLSKAWKVLSQHSACRHAYEEATNFGNDERNTTSEYKGFEILQIILLSAPLPGGRGDVYCDDTKLDDYLEEEIFEREEDEEGQSFGHQGQRQRRQPQQYEMDAGSDLDDIHIDYMDGVPSNAYLLWEPFPRRADKMRTLRYRHNLRLYGSSMDYHSEGAYNTSGSPTVPEIYQPRIALNVFRVWQESIQEIAFPAGAGMSLGASSARGLLASLFRRFPPLQQIISILVGVIPPSVATSSSFSWSERLLMELLYSRPDILPQDIAIRAKEAMKAEGESWHVNQLNEFICSIMEGNAGQVIETMFSLCGGSSGAALPATMTALICNLLVDSGCLSLMNDTTLPGINIQTELLLLASEAIISSFSVQGQSSVGVRTAIRLLLPHSPAKRSARIANDAESTQRDEIIYEPRIAAMIAEILSHRLPSTDAEARDLMGLCEETIRLGSVIVADACESLVFSRAVHHCSNVVREVHWLLRGIEIQSCWLPTDRQRRLGFASRRTFDSLCERYANSLISSLSLSASSKLSKSGLSDEQEKILASVLMAAKKLLDVVAQDHEMAPVLRGHIEANLLKNAVGIALADARGDSVGAASNVIHCLEERCFSDDHGGVVSTLANPKFYPELLNIAYAFLELRNASSNNGSIESATCDFTLHGMQILMARLTQISSWKNNLSRSWDDNITAMRLAFCKGLMRIISNEQPDAKATVLKSNHTEVSVDDEIEMLLSPRI